MTVLLSFASIIMARTVVGEDCGWLTAVWLGGCDGWLADAAAGLVVVDDER